MLSNTKIVDFDGFNKQLGHTSTRRPKLAIMMCLLTGLA